MQSQTSNCRFEGDAEIKETSHKYRTAARERRGANEPSGGCVFVFVTASLVCTFKSGPLDITASLCGGGALTETLPFKGQEKNNVLFHALM